jgi:phage shock protein A
MREILMLIADFVSELMPGRPATATSLDRSIAAAGSAHLAARKALAIAVAEETREIERRESLTTKVSDIESRAVQAIRAGRDDLAIAAAEAIAAIRTEIEASESASSRFAAEVALARREVDAQRRRLADLDRGRRLARVGSALNDRATGAGHGLDRFAEAEATLARINVDNADARAVREEMAPPADRVIEQMADQGFGRSITIRPADVMARLRMMATAPVLLESETSRRP